MVDASELLNLEKQTSCRYLYLAKILSGHRDLERECILTAFSMNPTQECFQLVCKMAEEYPTTDGNMTMITEKIDALPTITSADILLNSKDYDVLKAPNRLLDSLTGLSEGVRSDLVCLLGVSRIKNLNWLVPWHELRKQCEELILTEKKKQIVENTTAHANDKLQYININYDDYKDFTPHEYPGIEAGYEIYMADSDSAESVILINGDADHHSGGDDTDTAPESKPFIVKEHRRLRDRKRRLILKSQRLLEQSEQEISIKKEPVDLDQKKRKRRAPRKTVLVDGLKPRKPSRKSVKKVNSSGEVILPLDVSNIDMESTVRIELIDIKVEPNEEPIDVDAIKIEPKDDSNADAIKVEPIDVDAKDDCNVDATHTFNDEIKDEPTDADAREDCDVDASHTFNDEIKNEPIDADVRGDYEVEMSRTFTDLSNIEQINGTNFELSDSFHSGDMHHDINEMVKQNGFQPKIESYSELNYSTSPLEISKPNDQITIDRTIIGNSVLVNNIMPKNELLDQTFPAICDDDFDEDEKIDIQFQNMFGNAFLGLNHNISSLTNDETISRQAVVINEPEPEPIVINELYPLDQQPIQYEPFTILDNNSSCEMSENSSFGCTTPNLQSPKPKNPLLAFRIPKKNSKQNEMTTVDPSKGMKTSIISTFPLVTSPLTAFGFDDWACATPNQDYEQKSNGLIEHFLERHHNDNDISGKTSDSFANSQVILLQNKKKMN